MPTVFVETPRLRFHLQTQGDPAGLPLLLLHGSYATSRWWQPLLTILPEEIYALVPDLRGCGQSEKPATDYSIETQAADLAALVKTMGLTDFHLVAHSSAGAIAIEYILAHPEQVTTLILVDSVPVEGVFTPLDTLQLLELMKHDRSVLAQALATLMPTFATGDNPWFEQLVDDASQMAPAAFTGVAESLGRWNRFREAKHLTLPTLLIWGDRDEIVSRDVMTRTLIAIPGAANLEVLRNCGHSPMIEAPLALAERIVNFITEDYAGFSGIRQSVHQER